METRILANLPKRTLLKFLFLEETWTELNSIEKVSLRVEIEGLKNDGQVLLNACETVSTCYNNYYVEIFKNTVGSNYFMYMFRGAFSDMRTPVIKSIVYDHVLNVLFSSAPANITADDISSSLDDQTRERESSCLFETTNFGDQEQAAFFSRDKRNVE